MNDDILRAVEEAAARAEREGANFILQDQIADIARLAAQSAFHGLEALTHSGVYPSYPATRMKIRAQIAEAIRIILTRELMG